MAAASDFDDLETIINVDDGQIERIIHTDEIESELPLKPYVPLHELDLAIESVSLPDSRMMIPSILFASSNPCFDISTLSDDSSSKVVYQKELIISDDLIGQPFWTLNLFLEFDNPILDRFGKPDSMANFRLFKSRIEYFVNQINIRHSQKIELYSIQCDSLSPDILITFIGTSKYQYIQMIGKLFQIATIKYTYKFLKCPTVNTFPIYIGMPKFGLKWIITCRPGAQQYRYFGKKDDFDSFLSTTTSSFPSPPTFDYSPFLDTPEPETLQKPFVKPKPPMFSLEDTTHLPVYEQINELLKEPFTELSHELSHEFEKPITSSIFSGYQYTPFQKYMSLCLDD